MSILIIKLISFFSTKMSNLLTILFINSFKLIFSIFKLSISDWILDNSKISLTKIFNSSFNREVDNKYKELIYNFENNKIADCYDLYQQCIESPEKNSCKEYLWLWCADRGWPDTEQCKSALVSRYYLQEQKSSILQREVQNVCNYYHPAICDNWCEKQKDGHMKCPESSTLEK